MHLSYTPNLQVGSVPLDTDESLHVNKVLRLKIGDPIRLTNGEGSSANGIITSTAKKNVAVLVEEISTEKENPYLLELAIAPTKSNDRFELVLEKCSELGIRKIHPILTYHSERRKLNMERCQKILLSAMKQSQKVWLPEISEPIKFGDYVKDCKTENRLIAHCHTDIERISLKDSILRTPTVICIGPEGDFSPEEVKQAIDSNFKSVHLGNERLRTETAAIFATSIYHTICSL